MISKEIICSELKQKGYIELLKINGELYNGKDTFFCPQAPDLYMLYIGNGFSRIDKTGKSSFTAILTTKVNSIEDIDKLHREINNLILHQDESTVVRKFSGCLLSIAVLFVFSSFVYQILS
jgi:hypothetical protein